MSDTRTSAAKEDADGDTGGNGAAGIAAALRQLGIEGRAGLEAGKDAALALRDLAAADAALARSAFGRTLALIGAAIVFGASAWLLLMAALMVFLARQLGMPWALALLVCGLLSGGTAGWAAWQARRHFALTRMQATRRQLSRLSEWLLVWPRPGGEKRAGKHPRGTTAVEADPTPPAGASDVS